MKTVIAMVVLLLGMFLFIGVTVYRSMSFPHAKCDEVLAGSQIDVPQGVLEKCRSQLITDPHK
ncbi:MAG TPA: hypothetical protein PL140_08925 [Ferrovaceae bacterium]|uniref:hypothetical protein n=1 Tax=Ferrovum sp. JA12 TaxID=1356299 RepID=UPI00128EB277|nr:hypothetical protein [Ferrovum sp. JA12]HQT82323.1 hypothetical protein [Ferrovaceae bacterium]HQU07344.1 hypothetical protein [Ferrovaceae bacterium]